MNVMGWINKLNGKTVHYDDNGNKTTLAADGVTAERDPAYSQADMDAYQSGEITDVEYRSRYNHRFHKQR